MTATRTKLLRAAGILYLGIVLLAFPTTASAQGCWVDCFYAFDKCRQYCFPAGHGCDFGCSTCGEGCCSYWFCV